MHETRARTLRATALALVFLAAACGGGTGGGDSELSGSIQIDGSSTVLPISQAVAEEFRGQHRRVDVTVGSSGTGGGFERFCRGEIEISNASRPIGPEEQKLCEENGIEPVEMAVAIDGLTVAVNKATNFVDCLTVAQLETIWKPGSAVETWKDIDPSWPAEKIDFYAPGADSGTFDYFTEVIVGEAGAMRTGSAVQTSENDNILVQGIANDESAMGFFGYAYYVENQDRLKALAIGGGDGCVDPTQENIESGAYTPLSRPLFIYPRKDALPRPEVKSFIEFYLDNVNDLVGSVGYIPVPEARLEEARQELEDAAA